MTGRSTTPRRTATACLIFAALALSEIHALAQTRDSPERHRDWRDCRRRCGRRVHALGTDSVTLGQYAYGALVFGGIGAGTGRGRRAPCRAEIGLQVRKTAAATFHRTHYLARRQGRCHHVEMVTQHLFLTDPTCHC